MMIRPDRPTSKMITAQERCLSKRKILKMSASGKYELTNSIQRTKKLGISTILSLA